MKKIKKKNPKLGTVGGQAVMEGVMMRSREKTAVSVRQPENGKIVCRIKPSKSLRDKYKILKIPVLRGIVNFIEMMALSFSTLTMSTEMLGLEEEQPSKFEKWLDKKFGASLMKFVSFIAVILGVGLALLLFMYLPASLAKLTENAASSELGFFKNIIEGVLKIVIFILYICLTSLLKDIRRVYMYHGAEHKSIFCYESGEELTVENIRKQSRFHPRCGTSFLFVILIISIIVSTLIPSSTWDYMWLRVLYKLVSLPFIVGIGYEFIMYAGKHDNLFTRIMSRPGMWMQRITTKEPDDGMIEVAVVSLKAALPDEFPGFEIPLEEETDNSEQESPADENI